MMKRIVVKFFILFSCIYVFGLGDKNLQTEGITDIYDECDKREEERKAGAMVVLKCNGSRYEPFKCNLVDFGYRIGTEFDYYLLSNQIADVSSGNLTRAAKKFAPACKYDDWLCACVSINRNLTKSEPEELYFFPIVFRAVYRETNNQVAATTQTLPANQISGAGNITTNCTIFDRSTAKRDIPPESPLHMGFQSGKMISVRASFKPRAKTFVLNILNTDHRVAFQIKVQPKAKRIELSDKLGETWHVHRKFLTFLFKANETFQLALFHDTGRILIFSNDYRLATFSLKNNTDLSVAYYKMYGDVIVETVCYKDGKAPKAAKSELVHIIESLALGRIQSALANRII